MKLLLLQIYTYKEADITIECLPLLPKKIVQHTLIMKCIFLSISAFPDGTSCTKYGKKKKQKKCPKITYFALACVSICDLRLVDCANFLLQPSNGHTYGRSPVCIRTCVRKLKSNEKRLPQPSNVHWNGFSPVCTNWCRFNFELSTNALPHSAQTCTRGPCVCRCLRIAELSRNIFVHSLCGQAVNEKKRWKC